MTVKISLMLAAAAACTSAPAAAAQLGPTREAAPGYSSLLKSDYSSAEKEIRAANVSAYDPARSINLGVVFAKTGHPDNAAREFRQVLREDDVQIVVANGKTYSSHDVAARALAQLEAGTLGK